MVARQPRRKPAGSAEPAPLPDRILDARPDRLDLRDRPYQPPLRSLLPRHPADAAIARTLPGYVKAGLILDQGSEGACTGFGLACVANHLLWLRRLREGDSSPFERVSPRMLYELARRYDEWPGEDYDGSSARGAVKGWHKHGVCGDWFWPYPLDADGKPRFVSPLAGWDRDAGRRTIGVYYRVDPASVTDLQAAIAEIGAVYVTAQVHDGWSSLARTRALAPPRSHAELCRQRIPPIKDPASLGGHAFALVGYNEQGFVVQNSWGTAWGAAGFALLPYADWANHATDAWACALGVPAAETAGLVSSRRPVASGRAFGTLARGKRATGNPADDPWPIDRAFLNPAYRPCSTDQAYLHTLVSGNDGVLRVSDFTHDPADAAGYARRIALDQPLAWAGQHRGPLKLALYAHGGLNAETESIGRIRLLAPCFLANGIYPLFLTWRTGIAETLGQMAADWWRDIGGGAERSGGLADSLREAGDRALEAVAHRLGRGLWSEMRENARLAIDPGHALDLLAGQLIALQRALGRRPLELHLIGHSAGSLLLGHLLERLLRDDLRPRAPTVSSCSLYAPACSVGFAVERYLGAAAAGLLDPARLHLYNLSDANEKRDGLPDAAHPAYGKSLLYLVSRALDDTRKMPLLGFERAIVPSHEDDGDQWAAECLPQVQAWQHRWSGAGGLASIIASPTVRTTRSGGQAPASHGSFDNNLEVIGETLERIRGAPLVSPLEWLDY
jgi:hypothetical protein